MEDDERGDVPVGFDLRTTSVPINDLSVLRFRGDDKSLLQVKISLFRPLLILIRTEYALLTH